MLNDINDNDLEKHRQQQRNEEPPEEIDCQICGQSVYDYEIHYCEDCDMRVCPDCIEDGICKNCEDDTGEN